MTFDTSPATPQPHTNPDGAEEEERGMNSVTKMIYISISQHNILISSSPHGSWTEEAGLANLCPEFTITYYISIALWIGPSLATLVCVQPF